VARKKKEYTIAFEGDNDCCTDEECSCHEEPIYDFNVGGLHYIEADDVKDFCKIMGLDRDIHDIIKKSFMVTFVPAKNGEWMVAEINTGNRAIVYGLTIYDFDCSSHLIKDIPPGTYDLYFEQLP